VNQLKETAREANSNGRVIAPTKFLCTGGGQYFGMLFNKEGITRRNRRRAESSDDDNDDHSLPLFAPYTLELLCNAGGGSLSIGNLRGWSDSSNALGGGKFDCSINLCGKKKEHADHREEWKNCMSSKKIIACVLQDKWKLVGGKPLEIVETFKYLGRVTSKVGPSLILLISYFTVARNQSLALALGTRQTYIVEVF
jgi:hypothetical protein